MGHAARLLQKRKIAQARNDVERALGKIAYLHDMYKDVHPDYGEYLEAIAKCLLMSEDMMERFWELAWGSLPSNWDTYVGDGRDRPKG